MDLGIRGRVALVAASGRGLGLATAHRFAMEGCHVAICDKEESVLPAAVTQVQAADPSVRVAAYPVDLTQAEAINALVARVKAELGPVDILVTNSGGPPPGGFDEADDAKWEFAYKLTFLSAVRLIRAVLPDMKARRWGRIINFTSRALKEPIPNLMISNAVRLAVGGMAKTLAAEVAPYGITVNNLLPGPTSTDRQLELIANRAKRQNVPQEQALAEIVREIPIGRLARPEEQAAAAAFLASEPAGYITGVSLLVDGGAVKAL
ncbi:MAG: SDR family oxidoreductase [Armatimonadota bacterium]|nr:SDR family oxidoreductase [Armatimonadota bacterium]